MTNDETGAVFARNEIIAAEWLRGEIASLRAENERLKAFAEQLDDERDGYVKKLHEFACENERLKKWKEYLVQKFVSRGKLIEQKNAALVDLESQLDAARKELRAINRGAERNARINNSLIDQLAAERKKRVEAEKELERLKQR